MRNTFLKIFLYSIFATQLSVAVFSNFSSYSIK